MFDHVYVLNMDRRSERLDRFKQEVGASGWPFMEPERFHAIDGDVVPKPKWYTQQPGAWGCLQSHIHMWINAMNNGWDSMMIFEDDCVFHEDFSDRIGPFMQAIPDDWDMIYLGGLARRVTDDKPEKVNDLVWRLFGITGTWAMALRGRILPKLYQFFLNMPRERIGHVDRMLCEFHATMKPKVYAPFPWLCGMGGGQSDICTRNYQWDHWWHWDPASPEEPQYITQTLLSRVTFSGVEQIGSGAFGGIKMVNLPASL